jgi:cysteine desulfurase / selenocysteine lyase
MLNVKKVREQFPYLKHGKIYFNHASTGPLSTPVLESIQKMLFEKSETKIDEYLGLQAVIKETKSDLASLINTFPDRIAFVDNTTNGINILAAGLKLKQGDHILLNDLEFPANVYPFLNLQKNGIIIDYAKSHDGIVSAEDIIENIVPETRLISISQVQFLTGYRVDLEKIGKVCREKDIFFSVDAIQGLGAVRLDVNKDNIDFVSAGSQKWLLGLQGLGFVYVSEKLQDNIDQDCVGWLSVEDAWDLLHYELKLKNTADRYQGGTLNSIGIYALNASLKLFKHNGFNEIENKVIENTSYFLEQLGDTRFKPIINGLDKSNLSGIISFKDKDWKKIYDSLLNENIDCSVRLGYVRMSPHFYNIKEEIDKVVDILKKVE